MEPYKKVISADGPDNGLEEPYLKWLQERRKLSQTHIDVAGEQDAPKSR